MKYLNWFLLDRRSKSVTASSCRVTAFQAPRTLKRCRPEAARMNILVRLQRQHRKVPKTK